MSTTQSLQNSYVPPSADPIELELQIEDCVAKMLRASNEGNRDEAHTQWDELVFLVRHRSPQRIFEMEVAQRLRAAS